MDSKLRMPAYADLQSPAGTYIHGLGQVHSPLLRDVYAPEMGVLYYQHLLASVIMTPAEYMESFSKAMGIENPYPSLSNEQKNELDIFTLLTASGSGREELRRLLSLFVGGKLEWDDEKQGFLINKEKLSNGKISVDGLIDHDNFGDVIQVCLRFVGIEIEAPKNLKFKNEAARKFYEDFQKKKEKAKKRKKPDLDFSIPNMISTLCTFHNSLNYTNIFDLTVWQLQDTFGHQIRKNQNDIHDMNYAVWGGEYKPRQWFESMEQKENK